MKPLSVLTIWAAIVMLSLTQVSNAQRYKSVESYAHFFSSAPHGGH